MGYAGVATFNGVPGVPKGSASVTYTMSFPWTGGSDCGLFGTVSGKPWTASSAGSASCPVEFISQGLSSYWQYSLNFTYDSSGGTDAGCWNGVGPGVFTSGTQDCSFSSYVCQQVYVTGLGIYTGVANVGIFWPGTTYIFGVTECTPATATQTVIVCEPPVCDAECSSDADCYGGLCQDGTCVSPPPPGDQCYSDYDCDSGCTCEGGQCYCNGNGMGGCTSDAECGFNEYCDTSLYPAACEADAADPIIIDLTGAGFPLTTPQNGVKFDFFNNGKLVQLGWTQAGSNVGWLALDRNGDSKINDGAELFGNYSPQPNVRPMGPMGFRALAVFDEPAYGEKHDGVIDEKDAVFSKLRVWVDKNHNGISEPGELFTMKDVGIQSISLHYSESHWTDVYGNQFRYRSKITFNSGSNKDDRYLYDVVLVQGK